MSKTFFFYDLETSGLSPRRDRIMQFAGQRTDLELNPIGGAINLLVKLSNDTLPSPQAIAVTKITPQQTQADGLNEPKLCNFLTQEVFTPETIITGYNSVRFDDEYMRFLLWRNFYDPYEWQWKEGRSRWDLLDVVRMVRALRPEGINWPIDKEGKATNRLELLTRENHIAHEDAHDALSDVRALIGVAKLLKTRQPQMFKFLLQVRDKRCVQKLVNLEDKHPFVYTTGKYPAIFNKTSVAFPLTAGSNGNILVFDLRYNINDILSGKIDLTNKPLANPSEGGLDLRRQFFPVVKELVPNKCPAVAPISVLEKGAGWQKIGLEKAVVQKNLQDLLERADFAEQMREAYEKKQEWISVDAESALYDGFLPESDRVKAAAVRNGRAETLADFCPHFLDERLPDLLVHYKGRNFPESLTAEEEKKWLEYRNKRLNEQLPDFLNGMKELAENGENFLAEELSLWYQSLM